jgi:hypothetical protein
MSEHSHNGHAKRDAAGHITDLPDVSYIKNVDVTHETADVNVEGLLKFVVGLTIMTALTLVLMWGLMLLLKRQAASSNEAAKPGPMARSQEDRMPPEPRLQEAPGFQVKLEDGTVVPLDTQHAPGQPQAEYKVLRKQWDAVLQTGKANEASTSVGLPIDQAMKKVIESNAIKTKPGAVSWDQYPGGLPTAASSGRTIQKAIQ